jgi:hypothetical protein
MRLQLVAVTIEQNRAANPAAPAPTLNTESSHPDNHTDNSQRHAIVVLPPLSVWRDTLESNRRWLSRGHWIRIDDGTEPLMTVLEELGAATPAIGLAALRMWGQTGERPRQWLAAAEPVYLEAMLYHVRVHALRKGDMTADEVRDLVAYLNRQFVESARTFVEVDAGIYLQGGNAFATACCNSQLIDGLEPNKYLPIGTESREHDRLTGEFQLLLHESPFRQGREEQGRMPVNSIWLWGGGTAPPGSDLALPELLADDPVFRGFWQASGQTMTRWSSDLSWRNRPSPAFVAVLPPDHHDSRVIADLLSAVKWLLLRGKIHRLSVLCTDQNLLRLTRSQLFAVWRRRSLPAHVGDGE